MADFGSAPLTPRANRADLQPHGGGPANLADILERVLDKGIVIAGDIQINLLDIELLTIKIRLLVASVDRAKEMGINWWESDPALTTGAKDATDTEVLAEEVALEHHELYQRLERLERALELPTAAPTADEQAEPRGPRDARG
jgi:hypothetical protein